MNALKDSLQCLKPQIKKYVLLSKVLISSSPTSAQYGESGEEKVRVFLAKGKLQKRDLAKIVINREIDFPTDDFSNQAEFCNTQPE